MTVAKSLQTMSVMRGLIQKRVSSVEPSLLVQVPDGFRGNLLWQLGHLAVTPYLLIHGRGGLDMPISDDWLAAFKKGTTASDGCDQFTLDDVCAAMHRAVVDAENAISQIQQYERYETSAGIALETPEEALAFLAVHDGIHVGYVLALARALGA